MWPDGRGVDVEPDNGEGGLYLLRPVATGIGDGVY